MYEVGGTPFLTFQNAIGGEFSFDMCGILDLDQGRTSFFGEVKKYSDIGSQPQEYTEYLAKCYRAALSHENPYHFMWITWHPFSVTKWSRLCTAAEVRAAVRAYKAEYCGDAQDINVDLCDELADRLWLIVLSNRQEGSRCPTRCLVRYGRLSSEASPREPRNGRTSRRA